MNRKSKQQGVATIEWALVATAFFLIILGALEVSRLLFTWNTLDAMSQRAARIAAVCPPNHSAIRQVAMFGSPGDPGALLQNFTAANLQLTYLDETFSDTGGARNSSYVRAQIVNYQITLNLPFLDIAPTSPPFAAIVPAESLGYVPDTESFTCFGTA